MTVTVRIPFHLYRLTDGQNLIDAQCGTISDVLKYLDTSFPGLKEQICDNDGAVRSSIHIYVNGEDIRFLSGLQTRLEEGSRVAIIPAMAGGVS
jgi:sulfur-carrier protein